MGNAVAALPHLVRLNWYLYSKALHSEKARAKALMGMVISAVVGVAVTLACWRMPYGLWLSIAALCVAGMNVSFWWFRLLKSDCVSRNAQLAILGDARVERLRRALDGWSRSCSSPAEQIMDLGSLGGRHRGLYLGMPPRVANAALEELELLFRANGPLGSVPSSQYEVLALPAHVDMEIAMLVLEVDAALAKDSGSVTSVADEVWN